MAYVWNGEPRPESEQSAEELKRERARAQWREWHARNRDEFNAKQRERYARKRAAQNP